VVLRLANQISWATLAFTRIDTLILVLSNVTSELDPTVKVVGTARAKFHLPGFTLHKRVAVQSRRAEALESPILEISTIGMSSTSSRPAYLRACRVSNTRVVGAPVLLWTVSVHRAFRFTFRGLAHVSLQTKALFLPILIYTTPRIFSADVGIGASQLWPWSYGQLGLDDDDGFEGRTVGLDGKAFDPAVSSVALEAFAEASSVLSLTLGINPTLSR